MCICSVDASWAGHRGKPGFMREATLAVHSFGEAHGNAPVSDAIHPSTTYLWQGFEDEPKWIYSRYSHPNREALESAVAALEHARFAVAFGSGMAGIAASLEVAKAGDHVLIADDIYGGTYSLGQEVLPRHGIQVGSFDSLDPESVARNALPNTRCLIFEGPTNPTLRIPDIAAICEEARKRGILSIFDNTFATPILQKPLLLGADVVCHSTTKYLGGHSDVLGGVVATSDESVRDVLLQQAKLTGGVPSPFDCWLVCRGMKSLVARLRMQCDTAAQVAAYLARHPKVRHVNYPGLASHPGHDLARKQMSGFGAMLSFDVAGTPEDAMNCGKKLRIIKTAASLGGVESLISYPVKLSHAGLTEEQRVARGIPPTLLRLSIGLEDPEDLMEDLDLALSFG
jgi:cystathionine beta-lyase/cystathionine gamma-synthase